VHERLVAVLDLRARTRFLDRGPDGSISGLMPHRSHFDLGARSVHLLIEIY
jgi:hypothetical protein